MHVYKSNFSTLPGTSLAETMKAARKEYHHIQKRTPRRVPYVRSKYFTKDKIFINTFWEHLNQKSPKDRVRRLKLYTCAIDLLRNNTYAPESIYTNADKNAGLHRFYGQSGDGHYFCVQIKENKRSGRKEFISVFPVKNLNK